MSKYSIFILFAFVFLNTSLCFGQKRKSKKATTRAIVQYTDGSVFIGQIIYEGDLDMKIVLSTRDTITLNKVFIKRIRRTDKDIALFNGAKFHYTKGVFYSLQFGGGGDNDGVDGTGQLDAIVGYRFNKKLAEYHSVQDTGGHRREHSLIFRRLIVQLDD